MDTLEAVRVYLCFFNITCASELQNFDKPVFTRTRVYRAIPCANFEQARLQISAHFKPTSLCTQLNHPTHMRHHVDVA